MTPAFRSHPSLRDGSAVTARSHIRHASCSRNTSPLHCTSTQRGFWLWLNGLQQRRDNLMIETLHRWHVHGLHPHPFHRRICFRYFRDIPHSLPGIDRKPCSTQSNKCFAGLVHLRQHMERAPRSLPGQIGFRSIPAESGWLSCEDGAMKSSFANVSLREWIMPPKTDSLPPFTIAE